MSDDGKEPYPDDIEETTCGWLSGDVEVEYDEESDPRERMEPIPDDVEGDER